MTTSTFEPVARHTLSAEIRQRLAEAIRAGEFAPGEPLPAERTMCQQFGVSRTSVREAIQGLVIAGYLERRGNRAVVAERLPDVSFTGDDRKVFITELFEVRQVIEPAVVEMATRRATDDQRAELIELAAQTPQDLAEFREIDHRFHLLLARACGNPTLDELQTKVLGSLFDSGELGSLLYDRGNRDEVHEIITTSTAAHQAIAEAVAAGRPEEAVAAVAAHLDEVERRMVERLQ